MIGAQSFGRKLMALVALSCVVLICAAVLFLLHDTFVLSENVARSSNVRRGAAKSPTVLPQSIVESDRAFVNATDGNATTAVPLSRAEQERVDALLLQESGGRSVEAAASSSPSSAVALKIRTRTYARIAGADATGADLYFVQSATAAQCLKLCDVTPRCRYVVRNVSVGASVAARHSVACWLKAPAVLNAVASRYRELWVLARTVQRRIAIGVLSAPHLLATRLVACYATWLRHEDTIVLLENTTEARAAVSALFGRSLN